ncbi:ubiquinol-cytochrome c reductase iron-sulfur subunit [candidate division KSB1 bacterium]|nr:ubiquinol-cytochrome c reductase iron-sulfur subunit [candidate division KSB1 bacterium]
MAKKPTEVTRRSFLDYFLGGGVAAMLGSVFFPVLKYIMPPAIPQAVQNDVVAGKAGELAPNTAKIFRFGTKPGILVRTPEGDYRAFSAVCTHLQCTVQYRQDFKHIWCACHNGHFDLTGRNIAGPAPRPLEEYRVEIRGEEIVVIRQV